MNTGCLFQINSFVVGNGSFFFGRILKKTILQSYPLENMQKFILILKSLQNISIIFLHFLLFLIDVIYQSLAIDNLLHKWWECLTLETLSSGLVGNDTSIKIYLYLISCFDFQSCFLTLYGRY